MIYRIAKFLVHMLAPICGMFIALWIIWNVETRFFPVVKDFRVLSITMTPDGYIARGELVKARSCEFLGLTLYGHTNGQPKLLVAQFKKDIFGSDVGTGHQTWGPLTMKLPPSLAIYEHLEVQATHRCHALWMQTTEYTSIPVKDLMP